MRIASVLILQLFVYGFSAYNPCDQELGLSSVLLMPDANFSANYSSNMAKKGRLRNTESWCSDTSDLGSANWFQVDLGQVMVIRGAVLQGSPLKENSDNYIRKFSMQFSYDGLRFEDVRGVNDNLVQEFMGNSDSTTERRVMFLSPNIAFTGRYVRIYPTQLQAGKPCLRLELVGCPQVCASSMGLAKFSSTAPDVSVSDHTGSSVGLPALQLNGDGGWYAIPAANLELRINFKKVVTITGVAMQGRKNGPGYVNEYKLKYASASGDMKEVSGGKLFQGPQSEDGIVLSWLSEPLQTNGIYVLPARCKGNSDCGVRLELVGCWNDCMSKMGIENKKIADNQIEGSSWWSSDHLPHMGRLNSYSDWSSCNSATCSEQPTAKIVEQRNPYIQVCFDSVKLLAGLVIQGQGGFYAYLETFYLEYGTSLAKTYEYKVNGQRVIFNGTSNRYLSVEVGLPFAVFCQCVRLYGIDWKTVNIGMRWEVLGCDKAGSPPLLEYLRVEKNKLACSVRGQPGVSFSWLSASYPVVSDSAYDVKSTTLENAESVHESVLTIKDPPLQLSKVGECNRADDGRQMLLCSISFSCVANYEEGIPGKTSKNATFSSEVNGAPPSPVRLNVNSSNVLTWGTDPAGTYFAAVRFRVLLGKLGASQDEVKVIDGAGKPELQLVNLQAFTEYNVSVISVSKFDYLSLTSLAFRTDEGVAGPPENVTLVSKSSTSLTISWKKPNQVNGVLAKFRVECSRAQNREVLFSDGIPSASNISEVMGLAPFTEYSCKVQAFTKGGAIAGEWSAVETFTTDAAKSACMQPVGLETGIIPDSSLQPSVQSNVTGYRLNSGIRPCLPVTGSLLVDLGIVMNIVGFAFQGEGSVNIENVLVQYGFQTSTDLVKLFTEEPNQIDKKFPYPKDKATNRYWFPDSAFSARFVKFEFVRSPTSTLGNACFKVEMYGCSQICSDAISSHQLPSSSVIPDFNLYGPRSWCESSPEKSLQYDFGTAITVTGILLQGEDGPTMKRLDRFTIRYGADSSNLTSLTDGGVAKVFSGYASFSSAVVANWFRTPLVCRILEILPESVPQWCARFAFTGCHSGCVNPMGIADFRIADASLTASSCYATPANGPATGRLNSLNKDWVSCTGQACMSDNANGRKKEAKQGNKPWISACLKDVASISGVALQGQGYWNTDHITSFSIQFSYSVLGRFFDYKYPINSMVFPGTTNRYSTKTILFPVPFSAMCVRLTAETWAREEAAGRWEILGCSKALLPHVSVSSQSTSKDKVAQLECMVTGQPGAVVQWLSASKPVAADEMHLLPEAKLSDVVNGTSRFFLSINASTTNMIRRALFCVVVNDETKAAVCTFHYTCSAHYPGTSPNQQSGTLTVDGLSAYVGLPQNLVVDPITNTSAVIRFSSPDPRRSGDFPVAGYRIFVSELLKPDIVVYSIDVPSADAPVSVPSLQPYKDYEASVFAFNLLNQTSASRKMSFLSDEGVAAPPQILQLVAQSSTSLQLSWSAPKPANGKIADYLINYWLNLDGKVLEKRIVGNGHLDKTSAVLDGLKNYETYSVKVLAFTKNNLIPGNWSVVELRRTLEGVPSKPEDLNFRDLTARGVRLSWTMPLEPNGILGDYKVSFDGKKSYYPDFRQNGSFLTPDSHLLLDSLFPGTKYIARVQARTGGGEGPEAIVPFETPYGAPDKPTVLVETKPFVGQKVILQEISDFTGPISAYELVVSKDLACAMPNDSAVLQSNFTRVLDRRELPMEIILYAGEEKVDRIDMNLMTLATYTFCLRALIRTESKTYFGQVGKAVVERSSLKKMKNATVSSSTLLVFLTEGPSSTKFYQIIVMEVDVSLKADAFPEPSPDELKPFDKLLHTPGKPYVAAEFSASSFAEYRQFTVGDGKEYTYASRRGRRAVGTVYVNVALKPNAYYSMFQRAYVDDKTYYSTPWLPTVKMLAQVAPSNKGSSKNVGLIVGIVAGVLAAFAVVILVLFALKYRAKQSNTKELYKVRNMSVAFNQIVECDSPGGQVNEAMDDDDEAKSPLNTRKASPEAVLDQSPPDAIEVDERFKPVPVENFHAYYDSLRKDSHDKLTEEFRSLKSGQLYRWDDAKLPERKAKNRYANIVTYDHSRVLLTSDPNGDNYINASIVHGYSKSNMYIACQGPNAASLGDFWLMIWEQDIPVIVMTTNLLEKSKKKCEQYWPDQGSRSFGLIDVTLSMSDQFADYCVRKFAIKKAGGKEKRDVIQFHYTAWPDHGVPAHPSDVINFRRRIRKMFPVETVDRPVLVHCSAGVGRTGTFICIDAMLDIARERNVIDVFNYVNFMRTRRIHMVQTEEQYMFIYKALWEAFSCGMTEVNAADLRVEMRNLSAAVGERGKRGFDLQFERLNLLSPKVYPSMVTSAQLVYNQPKNRDADVLPYNETRVILQNACGLEGGDYINATYVNGYKCNDEYIATQHPLPSTQADFWHMIWEKQVATIVMLNGLQEDDIDYAVFWPKVHHQEHYGPLTVKHAAEDEDETLVIRKLHVQDSKNARHALLCTMFHLQDWPRNGVPSDPASLTTLLNHVEKSQHKNEDKPIVVMCSNGAWRAGTFIAVSIVMERLKLEQVVDVFQTVKKIRGCRYQFVGTETQYRYCYEFAMSYIDSFNTYSNYGEQLHRL